MNDTPVTNAHIKLRPWPWRPPLFDHGIMRAMMTRGTTQIRSDVSPCSWGTGPTSFSSMPSSCPNPLCTREASTMSSVANGLCSDTWIVSSKRVDPVKAPPRLGSSSRRQSNKPKLILRGRVFSGSPCWTVYVFVWTGFSLGFSMDLFSDEMPLWRLDLVRLKESSTLQPRR